MNKTDYQSDSDQSDDDFCPDNAGDSDLPSEEDTDDEVDDIEATKNKKGRKKVVAKKGKRAKKQASSTDLQDDVEESPNIEKRNTRQTYVSEKTPIEKDHLESDEDERSRTDALWADFLSDVNTASKKPAASTTNAASSKQITPSKNIKKPIEVEKNLGEKTTTTIKKVFNFAGEDVHVEETVNVDSIKENKTNDIKPMIRGLKRPAAGSSGLGSILNKIGKKNKISVLEKSKLDWNSFKKDEGIEEEIKTHNKGKDGYLDRQDFLERTDLRQFEIEKNIRQSRRNK